MDGGNGMDGLPVLDSLGQALAGCLPKPDAKLVTTAETWSHRQFRGSTRNLLVGLANALCQMMPENWKLNSSIPADVLTPSGPSCERHPTAAAGNRNSQPGKDELDWLYPAFHVVGICWCHHEKGGLLPRSAVLHATLLQWWWGHRSPSVMEMTRITQQHVLRPLEVLTVSFKPVFKLPLFSGSFCFSANVFHW